MEITRGMKGQQGQSSEIILTKRFRKYMFLSVSKTLEKKNLFFKYVKLLFHYAVNQISLYVIKYLYFIAGKTLPPIKFSSNSPTRLREKSRGLI